MSSETMDLVSFLRARLDEDERIAKAATPGPWWVDSTIHTESINAGDGTTIIAGARRGDEASVFESDEDAAHVIAHDPARVLREIEMKRKIVAAYLPPGQDPHPGLPCTDDIRDDPDGEAYAENVWDRGACVRHLKASETLLHHDYVLRLLATVYSDHCDYREEWRPASA